MNKTFYNLIRDIVEVYVDDIVVKTKVGSTLVEDLSREVHFWRLGREAAGFPSLTSRHRGKPS